MEFDIGNILYIIITLIVLSFGLLGKKRKKPGSGAPASEEGGSQPGFLENLERTLSRLGQEDREVMDLGEYESDLPPENVEYEEVAGSSPEPAPAPPSILDDYDTILKRLNEREIDSMLAEGQNFEEPIKVIDLEMEERGVDYFQVVKDFNAGTAVVYSAIINRLDY